MDASTLFHSLRRFIARFDVVLFERRPRHASRRAVHGKAQVQAQPQAQVQLQVETAAAPHPVLSRPASVAMSADIAVAAAVPAASPTQTMRTLEEVRADLARLRLSARERHAQAQVWRDTNFAPTDFMELA